MLQNIILMPILGLPAIAWGGMVTLLCLLYTAYLGATHGNIKTHVLMAKITIALALIHGILGVLAFL